MTEVVRIEAAAHIAYLDPMTGEGLLVLPSPAHDVYGFGGHSLHATDWDQLIARLDHLGWEPSEDEEGELLHVGTTTTGREIVGLYGREPICSTPSLRECTAALGELLARTV